MAAVTLRPPKTSRRSQRLTGQQSAQSLARRFPGSKTEPEAQREDAGSCRSHAVAPRPTQELRVIVPQRSQLAQVLFHSMALEVARATTYAQTTLPPPLFSSAREVEHPVLRGSAAGRSHGR
jgi:hypothetical protein